MAVTHINRSKRNLIMPDQDCGMRAKSSKRSKRTSLLHEVANGKLEKLKWLVNVEGLNVYSTDDFVMKNGLLLKNVPPLFAAILSDKHDMVKFLVEVSPHFELKKGTKEVFVFPEESDTEIIIDSLELVGAACVLNGNSGPIKHGLMCWREALKLRTEKKLPKPTCPQPPIEVLAIGQHREAANLTELEEILDMGYENCQLQSLLVTRRLLTKYDSFPSVYAVRSIYKFALRDWKNKRLHPTRVFFLCHYLISLIEPIMRRDRKLLDVIFHDLTKVLKDKRWSPTALCKINSVLTFEYLMTILRFVCTYLVNAFENRPHYQVHQLLAISEVVLEILRLLVLRPRTKEQRILLKDTLRAYFNNSNVWNIPRYNLLLKVCTRFHPIDLNSNDLDLIQLLLKGGASPNVVDSEKSSPLHILAKKESQNSRMWPYCVSEKHKRRFQSFTETVKVFLDQKHHHEFHDKPNASGHLAMEPLSRLQYPDPGLHRLLNTTLRNVPRLICIAASSVRKHCIDDEDVPISLQSLILQH